MNNIEFVKKIERINGNPFDTEQANAINYNFSKNLRLIAGAGKTATICALAAKLVEVDGINEKDICMVTFTKKAATEMKERVEKCLNRKTKMAVGTFHSIFFRTMRMIQNDFPECNKYTVNGKLAADEVSQKINELVGKYSLWCLQNDDKKLVDKISCWKNTNYTIDDIIKNISNAKEYEKEKELDVHLRKFFKELEDFQVNEGIINFDDMLLNLKNVLDNCPEVQEYVKNMFKYIFLDEFQDINELIMSILKYFISGENTRLVIVGDDDQSIYMFRGSVPRFLKVIDKDYDFETIYLMNNYRSKDTNTITLANRLIQKNVGDRLDKPLMKSSSLAKENAFINKYYSLDNMLAEAKFILSKMKNNNEFYEGIHTDDNGIEIYYTVADEMPRYLDNTILYRQKNQVQSILSVFLSEKIPFVLHGDAEDFLGVFANTLFRRTWDTWRKLFEAETEDFSVWNKIFEDIVNVMYIPNKLYFEFREHNSNDLNDLINKFILFVAGAAKTGDNKFIATTYINKYINELRLLKSGSPLASIDNAFNLLAHTPKYVNNDETEFIAEMCKEAKTYENLLKEYKRKYAMMKIMKQRLEAFDNQRYNGVQIMSIHKSKGLAFKNVFVIGCYKGGIPSSKAEFKMSVRIPENEYFKLATPPTLIEEERRLMYVAVTRAKENLYLTLPENVGNGKTEQSMFIREMGIEKGNENE